MQMKIRHFIVLVTLLQASTAFGGTFSESININGNDVSVHITSTDATGISVTNGKPWRLKNGYAIGGWPADPKGRIISFTVKWGTNEYKVAEELYSDVFNSLLKTKRGWWDNGGGVLIRPSHDQSHILVELDSSHVACCGYVVQWLINKNGEVTRFVDISVP